MPQQLVELFIVNRFIRLDDDVKESVRSNSHKNGFFLINAALVTTTVAVTKLCYFFFVPVPYALEALTVIRDCAKLVIGR